MSWVRRRIGLIVFGVMLHQGVFLMAAPVALCCLECLREGTTEAAGGHSEPVATGEACPMHGHDRVIEQPSDASACTMSPVCLDPAAMALKALSSLHGILSSRARAPLGPTVGDRVCPMVPGPDSYTWAPPSPPPRHLS